MRVTSALGVIALAVSTAFAKELPKDEVKGAELYDTGIIHEQLINAKLVSYAELSFLIPN